MAITNVLTVDVEEYFHPTEVRLVNQSREWLRLPSRVEGQTVQILELLDRHRITGTFFVLGWLAERQPHLVRQIRDAGHEIGCHSYTHRLVYNLSVAEFREDTRRAVRAIEDACGVRPRIYRAPSYSVVARSLWALEVLVECGFTHDSSIYPIAHDRYGIPGFSRHACRIETPSGPIYEVPAATVRLSDTRIAPVGGGGYLRLLPYRYTAAGIRRVNQSEGRPVVVYFHPWEIDPDQPRLTSGIISSLRTYTGLTGMGRKLERLVSEFRFSTMTAVHPVEAMQGLEMQAIVPLGPVQ